MTIRGRARRELKIPKNNVTAAWDYQVTPLGIHFIYFCKNHTGAFQLTDYIFKPFRYKISNTTVAEPKQGKEIYFAIFP
jgi:hypothetical protein